MKIENLKCCANCKNNDITDGGTLQCCIEKNVSEYNHATCPSGYCDDWTYDNETKARRKKYI